MSLPTTQPAKTPVPRVHTTTAQTSMRKTIRIWRNEHSEREQQGGCCLRGWVSAIVISGDYAGWNNGLAKVVSVAFSSRRLSSLVCTWRWCSVWPRCRRHFLPLVVDTRLPDGPWGPGVDLPPAQQFSSSTR